MQLAERVLREDLGSSFDAGGCEGSTILLCLYCSLRRQREASASTWEDLLTQLWEETVLLPSTMKAGAHGTGSITLLPRPLATQYTCAAWTDVRLTDPHFAVCPTKPIALRDLQSLQLRFRPCRNPIYNSPVRNSRVVWAMLTSTALPDMASTFPCWHTFPQMCFSVSGVTDGCLYRSGLPGHWVIEPFVGGEQLAEPCALHCKLCTERLSCSSSASLIELLKQHAISTRHVIFMEVCTGGPCSVTT